MPNTYFPGNDVIDTSLDVCMSGINLKENLLLRLRLMSALNSGIIGFWSFAFYRKKRFKIDHEFNIFFPLAWFCGQPFRSKNDLKNQKKYLEVYTNIQNNFF